MKPIRTAEQSNGGEAMQGEWQKEEVIERRLERLEAPSDTYDSPSYDRQAGVSTRQLAAQ